VQADLVPRRTTALRRPQARCQGGGLVLLTLHHGFRVDRPGDHHPPLRIEIEQPIDQITLGLELEEHIGELPHKGHQQAGKARQRVERQAIAELA
jgi:hypothetical protein